MTRALLVDVGARRGDHFLALPLRFAFALRFALASALALALALAFSWDNLQSSQCPFSDMNWSYEQKNFGQYSFTVLHGMTLVSAGIASYLSNCSAIKYMFHLCVFLFTLPPKIYSCLAKGR